MCVSPIRIKNPSYLSDFYCYESGKVRKASKRLMFDSEFIDVPCGKCIECRRTLYSSYLQRVQMESATSYVFMVTLTYDDQHIPEISFTTDKGLLNVYYSDIKHVQQMLKRLRKYEFFNERSLRYFAVTEYGTERFRPHHHLLLFVSRLDTDTPTTGKNIESYLYDLVKSEWRINVGSCRVPIYEPLFTYCSKMVRGSLVANYDLHLVTDDKFINDSFNSSSNSFDSVSSACKYLISYMLKPNQYESELLYALSQSAEYLPEDISRRLKSILSCSTHYSKHLGFGFDTSSGTKVIPSITYKRCNAFSVSFWNIYQSLPDTLEQFGDIYDISLYNGLISSFMNRIRIGGNFIDLFSRVSEFELIYYVAIFKYERYIFNTLIFRNNMDVLSFNLILPPLTRYDSSFKSSLTYRSVRKMVVDSANYGIPFIGFRYEDTSGIKFVPLCSYFKKYCCIEQDFLDLLDRIGASTLSDIPRVESSLTSRSKISSYNTGMSTYHLQRMELSDFKKLTAKKCQNFGNLKSLCIFAPVIR